MRKASLSGVFTVGVVLGVAVFAWSLIMGVTGWYKHPTLLNLFWMVIPLQIFILWWGLRRTAAQGNGYLAQIGSGLLMSLIGAVIIFAGSLLLTTVIFPQYFQDLADLGRQMMRAEGRAEADIETYLQQIAPTQTPLMQALLGFIGTIATGFVASLAIGSVVRAPR